MAGGPVEAYVGTMPVPERHRVDAVRLEKYLRQYIPDLAGTLSIEQFRGGQSNPTYRVSAGGARYVLRRKPPGKLLPSAHAVDREYRVMTALEGSEVPVPKTFCLCQDDSVIGTAFYVMEHVEGRVFWDPALPGLANAERSAIFAEMNRVIAALHRVDLVARGLADYGKAGGYLTRQIARWTKQYRASETEHIEAMERLIEWLPAHIPPGDETAIVHGDYRLDNLVFHPHEARILAVLDWELSTLGHPLADFAYHCMSWRIPGGTFRGMEGLDLTALGIPTEPEYVAAYCGRTGRRPIDPDEWGFYIAYNMFRAAGIAQGIMGRVRDGTATSAHALEAGRSARMMAERGWKQVEQMVGGRSSAAPMSR
jgi:aminoglycoside phosphotransferase (APT) family kinase protein